MTKPDDALMNAMEVLISCHSSAITILHDDDVGLAVVVTRRTDVTAAMVTVTKAIMAAVDAEALPALLASFDATHEATTRLSRELAAKIMECAALRNELADARAAAFANERTEPVEAFVPAVNDEHVNVVLTSTTEER